MVKFLVIGDLHGNIPKIHFKDFDAIIAPGDFCSMAQRKYIFEAMQKMMDNPKLDINWVDLVGKKKAREMVKNSLKDGRAVLEFLNKQNVPVFLVPGNTDFARKSKGAEISPKNRFPDLLKGLGNLHNIHFKKKTFMGVDLVGYGLNSGPEIPQYNIDKRDKTKKQLSKIREKSKKTLDRISKLNNKCKNPVLFLSHNVPFNTKLDLIKNKMSPRNGHHLGSVVARNFIEKCNPLVCIGGHMHEHFGKQKLGKTVCINSGFGQVVNTLLEIENGKIKQIKFFPKEY